MAQPIIVDASLVVALADTRDKWHAGAAALRDALLASGAELVYFDCVVNESVSVLGRRAEEQGRSDQFDLLLDRLITLIPEARITWIAAAGKRLYSDVLEICRDHQGRLNFNDGLISLASRELGVRFIVSFDADFDEVAWLARVASPAQLPLPPTSESAESG
jgi:predicted nucleic acid-binding protein